MTKEEYNNALVELGMWRMQLTTAIQYPYDYVYFGSSYQIGKFAYLNMINTKIYMLTEAIAEYERNNRDDNNQPATE